MEVGNSWIGAFEEKLSLTHTREPHGEAANNFSLSEMLAKLFGPIEISIQ
jgi:hypothetical protein